MEPISPADALLLIGESREHPMHAGSLQLFEPPEDAGLIPGYLSTTSPPFNIVISNVPAGPSGPLYWRGARLDGNYPLSIPLDGQAVNITVTNNPDNLDFGLVGCWRSVPHPQRLLGHLEASLKDLERAFGT